jgi:murein DD-endopeptidase MepM/ murein hydrolase activator NlpD
MRDRMPFRLRLMLVAAAVPLGLWAALPMASNGATPQELQQKIERERGRIAQTKGRERVLASDIAGYTKRISALQGDITTLQARRVRLQADLDAKRAQLERIQADLRRERLRLARLRARLVEARVALAGRLVALYKADKPDIVTVALNANGFEDLLERSEFMERVSEQDARIIARVTEARTEAIATARRLDALEAKSRRIAEAIESRRDEVVHVEARLVDRQRGWQSARSERQTVLAATREDRHELEGKVAGLEKEQARVTATLAQAARESASPLAGPVRHGSGALIWPANGPVSSGFGPRWGRLHAGIDLPLAVGTPLRAAQSGRVVLAGWTGGYGNYTCIQHSGGLSTCYAHQSRLGTSVGASVGQGQVIGYSGNTGNSTGPHLHFETRVNGQPVDPFNYL